ncbi:MAG: 16S rRNA (adenine(1518)-N(6)/adenine(1519)-N(6))-dimethyltransferase RsmA [Candidatus Omnitrophota bacterium]
MKLSHSLGQVLLKDKACIEKILATLEISGQNVLEIGPGTGEITGRILEAARFLYCVELDTRFYNLLREKFKSSHTIEIFNQDILDFKLCELNTTVVVFGNVPYQISNNLMRYLTDNRQYIQKAYLTLQKEFVDKLIARVSTKSYGFLSCFIQYYARIEKVFDIPAKAFVPVPNVDSSFIRLEFYGQPPYLAKNEIFLFKVIRGAFSQRRKKIINALAFLQDIKKVLLALDIDSSLRPENLSLQDYVRISDKFAQG